MFRSTLHCTKNLISVFLEMKLHGFLPNSYIHVFCELFIYSQDRSVCLSGYMKIGRPILGIYKSSQIYMNGEIGKQNIIIMFLKKWGHTVSFMGIHKSEPDIYNGFSPALHLQCACPVVYLLSDPVKYTALYEYLHVL